MAAGVLAAAAVLLGGEGDGPPVAGPTTTATTATTATTTTTLAPTTVTTAAVTTVPPRPSTSRPTSTVARPTTTVTAVAPAIAVRRGDPNRRAVALTFDAGSDAGSTSRILDTLAANRVVATFGITGRWAEANRGLVARIADDGHQLVNHTWDHRSFTGRSTGTSPLTRAQRLEELARAEAAIRDAAGTGAAPWFRPPYGDEDARVRADVALAGYRYELLWTVDSLGWKGLAPDAVAARCLDQAAPGAIYLFHVGSASTDHDALQTVITGLRATGYEFVTATGMVP